VIKQGLMVGVAFLACLGVECSATTVWMLHRHCTDAGLWGCLRVLCRVLPITAFCTEQDIDKEVLDSCLSFLQADPLEPYVTVLTNVPAVLQVRFHKYVGGGQAGKTGSETACMDWSIKTVCMQGHYEACCVQQIWWCCTVAACCCLGWCCCLFLLIIVLCRKPAEVLAGSHPVVQAILDAKTRRYQGCYKVCSRVSLCCLWCFAKHHMHHTCLPACVLNTNSQCNHCMGEYFLSHSCIAGAHGTSGGHS
jgi:hypothetical protein